MLAPWLRSAHAHQLTLLGGSFVVTLAILAGASHLIRGAAHPPTDAAAVLPTATPVRTTAAPPPTAPPPPRASASPFTLGITSPLPEPTRPPLVLERPDVEPGAPELLVLAGSSYASRRFDRGGSITAEGESLMIDARGLSGTLRVTWTLPSDAIPAAEPGTKVDIEVCVTAWGYDWQLAAAGGVVSPLIGEGVDDDWWNEYLAAPPSRTTDAQGISDCWPLPPAGTTETELVATVNAGNAMAVHEIRYEITRQP